MLLCYTNMYHVFPEHPCHGKKKRKSPANSAIIKISSDGTSDDNPTEDPQGPNPPEHDNPPEDPQGPNPPETPQVPQDGRCPYCFLQPCIAQCNSTARWMPPAQGPCVNNAEIRWGLYRRFWKCIANTGGWVIPEYLDKKRQVGGGDWVVIP